MIRREPRFAGADFFGCAGAGADDEGFAGFGQSGEERKVDDVGAGGFVGVPGELLGDGNQLGGEDADDGIYAAGLGECDAGGEMLDAKFETLEHGDGIGFARGLLVGGELGSAAHEAVGLEELELDGVGTGIYGEVGEINSAGRITIVIDAEFGDDVGGLAAADGA